MRMQLPLKASRCVNGMDLSSRESFAIGDAEVGGAVLNRVVISAGGIRIVFCRIRYEIVWSVHGLTGNSPSERRSGGRN